MVYIGNTQSHERNKLTPIEIQDAAIDLYLSGLSVDKCANRLCIGRKAVVNALKRRGIVLRTMSEAMTLRHSQNAELIPQSVQSVVIERYNNGLSIMNSVEGTGYGYAAVCRILSMHGIKRRGYKEANRHYHFNTRFFETIDTEEKAYWLGFITADGTVSHKINTLSISLAYRDIEHIKKLQTVLGSEHKLYISYNKSPASDTMCKYARLSLSSIDLVSDLVTHGVVPNKSLIVKPSPHIPDELLRHYWRGVLDGDGWITHSISRSTGRKFWSIGCIGSRDIVHGFRSFCAGVSGTTTVPYQRGNIWGISIGGNNMVRAISNAFVTGNNLCRLDRKHLLLEKIIA